MDCYLRRASVRSEIFQSRASDFCIIDWNSFNCRERFQRNGLGLQRCRYPERVVRHSIWNMANRLNGSGRFYDWNSCCSILRHRMVLHYKQLHNCNSPVEELGHRNQRSKFDNCNAQNIYNGESVTDYLDKW